MSIANLFYPNNLDLYCNSITTNSDADDNLNDSQLTGAQLTKAGWVIRRSSSFGGVEANLVESPAIIWDDTNHIYYMSYVGYSDNAGNPFSGSAMLASSNDLYNWTKLGPILSRNPLSGQPDSGGITGPVLYKKDGIYYLYYIGCPVTGYEGAPTSICLATSTSPTGPYVRNNTNPIISRSGTGWRSLQIFHPNITFWNGVNYMFFNAQGVVNGIVEERTGFATSDDLVNWVVDDVNSPVLPDNAVGAWQASQRVGDPSIYEVGKYFFMAYFSVPNPLTAAYDGIAYTRKSTFPIGWQRWDAVNPVLSPGTEYDAIDTLFAHKPFIISKDNTHYHYYTSVNASERGIGLAMQENFPSRARSIGLIRNTTQSIPGNAQTNILWGSQVWYDTTTFLWPTTTNDAITVLHDGFYDLHCYCTFAAAGTGIRVISVTLNGNPTWCQEVANFTSVGNPDRLNLHFTAHILQGTVVRFRAFQTSGGALNIGGADVGLTEGNIFCSITRIVG
jgi:predicted GH43/DUF377 family glycosyl hydrolase